MKFEFEIPEVTDAKSAQEAIKILLEPVGLTEAEEIADKYKLRMYRGDYGSGETYYPKGTEVEENGLEHSCSYYDYDLDTDEEGKEILANGIWVSSSDMC